MQKNAARGGAAVQTSPHVLVHGIFGWGESEPIYKVFPYWGTTSGDAVKLVREMGHEVYTATVGPLSGAWYTACELYAQLTGTRVDYGEYHSKKSGQRRFGRTYDKPLVDGWGEGRKIHLIGHSYGASTVRMFTHLLTYGAPEEVAESGKENVSPFFLGGQQDRIASVTSVCGSLNPTRTFTVAQKYKLVPVLKKGIIGGTALLSRSRFGGKALSCRLERLGICDTPGKHDRLPLREAFALEEADPNSVYDDLSPEGLQRINDYVDITEGIPFVSFPFDFVKRHGKLVLFKSYFPLLYAITSLIFFDNFITGRGIDKIHDGLLEIEAAEHPDDEPFVYYDAEEGFKDGMWNIMPITYSDHGLPVGLFHGKKETRDCIHNILTVLEKEEIRKLEAEAAKKEAEEKAISNM